MSSKNIQQIPASKIRENPVALRELDRESEAYKGLIESIRLSGFTSVITVTPVPAGKDAATGAEYDAHFRIVDGLHRFSAGKDAGVTDFPCMILEIKDENDLLSRQLMANLHKVDTKPIEYTRQIQRMINNNPLMTIAQISTMLGVTPPFITGRLRLLKLADPIQKLVDDGKVNLSNAQFLAKLPVEEQEDFLERAMVQTPAEFAAAVSKRAKELKDAARQGRDPAEEQFAPIPKLKKLKEIEEETGTFRSLTDLIAKSGAKTAQEGAKLALQWVVSLDPNGVSAQKAAHDERAAKRKADAEIRKGDRLKKKEEAARQEREKYEAAKSGTPVAAGAGA